MKHRFRIRTCPYPYDGYMIDCKTVLGFWLFWDFANSLEEAERKCNAVGRKSIYIKEIEVE